MGLLSFEEI